MPYRTKQLQEPAEITRLAKVLAAAGVRSYLEIGSKYGGSLWTVAQALPAGSRIVAVDLPNGTREWSASTGSLQSCVEDLERHGYNAHLIWGDSTAPGVIAQVSALGPFDAVFIDANHTRPYVENDWAHYGGMARIVAFHDIAWARAPTWVGTRIDVPELWDAIKSGYRHEEIRLCPTGKNNGIGVLWRW